MTEAAFTLIIYFTMHNVLRAHHRSLFVRKRTTMTKITCVHVEHKNTVKKKTSVKKMVSKSKNLVSKIFELVASWCLTIKVHFEPWGPLWLPCGKNNL